MVSISADLAVHWVNSLLWPFLRIGAMLMASPIFGAKTVSVQTRILLAFALTWMVLPMLPEVPNVDPLTPEGFLIGLHQVVIGISMGFVMHLAFGATVIMGQTLGMSMGLGFASVVDPQNGVQVPVVSQFFTLLATLIFLSMNGHVILISILLDSFQTVPVGGGGWHSDVPRTIALWASRMFSSALLMALPVITTVLLVNLALGVITRTAPQLNIFAIGFPIAIMVGLSMMILVLPIFMQQIMSLFAEAFDFLAYLSDVTWRS